MYTPGRYSEEFKELLLRRWQAEGKNPASFERKVWRWLCASRRGLSRAERRYQKVVEDWAHNRTGNTRASEKYNTQVRENISKGQRERHARRRAAAQGE